MPQAAAALSAFGGGMSADANYKSGQYNSQVARNNQMVANANADFAVFRGQQAEGLSRQRTAQTIGSERAGYGASGIDANSGSAARTQGDTAALGEVDAQTIRANAARSAWGYRAQATNFGDEATLDKSKGDFGAMASLVGAGSDFANKWDMYKNSGVVQGP